MFDAAAAETYRLLRNRLTVFLSVLLVPLLFAVGGAIYHWMNKNNGDPLAAAAGLPIDGAGSPLNMAAALIFGANHGANGALLTFMLIAAATVYAGDYRWETWRLISARNSRHALILGKIATMKLMALLATAGMVVAAIVYFLAQAVIFDRPMTFSLPAAQAGDFLLLWLLSFVRLMQYGLIALVTAVVTRSLLAALFVPWALGFSQSVLGAPPVMMLLKLHPDSWQAQLLMPGLAYDTLKNLAAPGSAQAMSSADGATAAIASLILWSLVPVALALLLFRRQDLSKE